MVGVGAAKVGTSDEPEVSKNVCEAESKFGAEKVIVYTEPGVPKTPKLVKETTPCDALAVKVPRRTPPLETEAVTVAVELVTALPVAS